MGEKVSDAWYSIENTDRIEEMIDYDEDISKFDFIYVLGRVGDVATILMKSESGDEIGYRGNVEEVDASRLDELLEEGAISFDQT